MEDTVVRSPDDVAPGDRVRLLVAEGELTATITSDAE
jgi:exonuclease VII large subunit